MDHQTETGDSIGLPRAADTAEAAVADDVAMATKEDSTAG